MLAHDTRLRLLAGFALAAMTSSPGVFAAQCNPCGNVINMYDETTVVPPDVPPHQQRLYLKSLDPEDRPRPDKIRLRGWADAAAAYAGWVPVGSGVGARLCFDAASGATMAPIDIVLADQNWNGITGWSSFDNGTRWYYVDRSNPPEKIKVKVELRSPTEVKLFALLKKGTYGTGPMAGDLPVRGFFYFDKGPALADCIATTFTAGECRMRNPATTATCSK